MFDCGRLRELLQAATPGPWEQLVWYGNEGGWRAVGPEHRAFVSEDESEEDEEPESPAHVAAKRDAALIVALVSAAPAMLDELERLHEGYDAQFRGIQSLQIEVERLKVVATYARHMTACSAYGAYGPCTCGLDAARGATP